MTSSSSEPQAVSPAAETCCCSWTGGKDCNLALLRAWRDPSLRVSCLVVFRPEGSKSKSFDAHPLNLMDAQSSSLGLPLHRVVLPSSKSYRDGYVDAIKWLRDEHGVSVICTGDMDLVGSMTTNWITDCAAAAGGVRAYHPLWEADRASCLNDLVRENFTVLFSCVKQPWFDESWCGRALDERAIEEMTTMSEAPASLEDGVDAVELHPKDPRRLPLDLGGEQGEYHTMCIDGPLYSRPIELELGRPKRTVTEPAKEGEERWWTYDGQQWWTLGEFTVKKNRDGIQEEKAGRVCARDLRTPGHSARSNTGEEGPPLAALGDSLTVGTTDLKGRGVFATRDIPPFTHVHTAPCILVSRDEYESRMRHTILDAYLFNCGDGDRLLSLGVGSLFNHSSRAPNVDYRIDKSALTILYSTSYRAVKAGEELCIYYGDDLWFDDEDGKEPPSSSGGRAARTRDRTQARGNFLHSSNGSIYTMDNGG